MYTDCGCSLLTSTHHNLSCHKPFDSCDPFRHRSKSLEQVLFLPFMEGIDHIISWISFFAFRRPLTPWDIYTPWYRVKRQSTLSQNGIVMVLKET